MIRMYCANSECGWSYETNPTMATITLCPKCHGVEFSSQLVVCNHCRRKVDPKILLKRPRTYRAGKIIMDTATNEEWDGTFRGRDYGEYYEW